MADQSNPLLDLLGGLSQGVQEIAAFRQAALGNPAPVQMLQEQRQRQNLLNQLTSMIQQPEIAPYKNEIQQRLSFGDIEGAQKLASDLPRQAKFQGMIMSSPSLTDEQKTGIIAQSGINLSSALAQYNKMLEEQRQQKSKFAFETTKEQSRLQREERRNAEQLAKEERKRKEDELRQQPLNILTTAVSEGVLNADSTQEEIAGVLMANKAKLSANEKQRAAQVKELLNNPQLKTLFPNANLNWWQKIFRSSKSEQPSATAATPAPAAKTIRLRSQSGQERVVADTPENRKLAQQKQMTILE